MIYQNFLNTPYKPYYNTIVFGNLRNFYEESSPYIVYCEPEILPIEEFPDFIDGFSSNNYKKHLTFRTKKIFKRKINLLFVFNSLKSYLNDNTLTDSETPLMNIKKFFFPYYTNIDIKTVYWNVMTYENVITQLNLLYETKEPITYDNLPHIEDLIIGDCPRDLRIEINYDLRCPYFSQPVRFIFQYLFQIKCNVNI